jgi:dihydroorotate dehydrogenase (fumarate)
VSMPLRDGPACFGAIRERLTQFMQQHGFASVAAMKGRVSLADVADPVAFQRAHYIRTLQSWRSPPRT